MTTAFLIISLSRRITLLKQRGLCELCEIAETLSKVYAQAAQAHSVGVRASEVIWSEYTRIINVLSDAK